MSTPPPPTDDTPTARFLMQAAIGIPMTVYGTGGQTRGFIHVTDTAKCLEAAVVNPPPANGPVEIFNQASVGARRERGAGGYVIFSYAMHTS